MIILISFLPLLFYFKGCTPKDERIKTMADGLIFSNLLNVLGVLLGGLIGNGAASGQSHNPTLLALGVVCVTLILLPPLRTRLTTLLKNHAYLTTVCEMPAQEQTRLICGFNITENLTEREGEIADLLIKVKTYRMIACELHVSENTVKTHVKNIYSKAAVKSRTELVNLLLDIHVSSTESHRP